MKEFEVIYKETLVHVFYVQADSEEDARDEFENQVFEGLIDFSDGEITETEIIISESTLEN